MESTRTISEGSPVSTKSPTEADFDPVGRADHELLKIFQQTADAEAFSALVQRHHGLVYTIANRMLGCSHAAEDVVQASFLVLARDARKIRKSRSLVSWLYGVAHRISAREVRRRSQTTLSSLEDRAMVAADPLDRLNAQFEQNIVLEELNRLHDTYRAPLVLRYLQGKSNQQIASELKQSETAVEGRLKRGRRQLRMRLSRRGVSYGLGIGILGIVAQEAAATELPNLVSRTLATSLAGASADSTLEADQTHEFTRMAEEEIFKMVTSKIVGFTAMAGLAMGVIASGWALAEDDLTSSGGTQAMIPLASSQTTNSQVRGTPVVLDSGSQETDTSAELAGGSPSGVEVGGGDTEPTDAKDKLNLNTVERLRRLDHYSIESIAENEIRILEKLREPASFDYFETRLDDVVAEIASVYGISVRIDEEAMHDLSLAGPEELMTMKIDNVSLENALELMLARKQLTTMIKNEVLIITSQEVEDQSLTTRVYRIPDEWLLDNRGLIEVILNGVQPELWQENGGEGTMSPISGEALVISAPQRVHRQVNGLFAQLNRLYARK